MAELYINSKGWPVRSHSYSGGQTFRGCPLRYKYERLQGWKEREVRASAEFGKSVEDGISYYHKSGCKPGFGVDDFKRSWLERKSADLTYSERDGSWEELYRAGAELLALYELRWRSFGYTDPQFQLKYQKSPFPGDPVLGDLGFMAYVDMKANIYKTTVVDPCGDIPYPIIIDIKTSGGYLDETPGILQLDPQLRAYSWVSGIRDVGFLWLQKSASSTYKKGDTVTLLSGIGLFRAGDEVQVFQSKDGFLSIADAENIKSISADLEEISGKGSESRKAALLSEWRSNGRLSEIESKWVTKQRISFVHTRIPEEAAKEQGQVIGKEIVDIFYANQKGEFPANPGVRWPDDRCVRCPMLGLCLKNDKMVEEKLISPVTGLPPAKTENWLEQI